MSRDSHQEHQDPLSQYLENHSIDILLASSPPADILTSQSLKPSGPHLTCFCNRSNADAVADNPSIPPVPSLTHPAPLLSQVACRCFTAQQQKIKHLQLQLKTAAELGHALLLRHKAYISQTEDIKSTMRYEISQLKSQLDHFAAENSRIYLENSLLVSDLEHVSDSLTAAELKVSELTQTLKLEQEKIAKIRHFKARSDALEYQISLLEDARESLLQENSQVNCDKKKVEARWHKTERMLQQLTLQYEALERDSVEKPTLDPAHSIDSIDSLCRGRTINAKNIPELKILLQSLATKNTCLESTANSLGRDLDASKTEIAHLRRQLAYAINMSSTPSLPQSPDNSHILSQSPPQIDIFSNNQHHCSKDEAELSFPICFDCSTETSNTTLAEEIKRTGTLASLAHKPDVPDQILYQPPLVTTHLHRCDSQESILSLDNVLYNTHPLSSTISTPFELSSPSSSHSLNLLGAENQHLVVTPSPVLSQITSVSASGTFSKGDLDFKSTYINTSLDSPVNKPRRSLNDQAENAKSELLKPKIPLDFSVAKLASMMSNNNISTQLKEPVDSVSKHLGTSKSPQKKWPSLFTKWNSLNASDSTSQLNGNVIYTSDNNNLSSADHTDIHGSDTSILRIEDESQADCAHSHSLDSTKQSNDICILSNSPSKPFEPLDSSSTAPPRLILPNLSQSLNLSKNIKITIPSPVSTDYPALVVPGSNPVVSSSSKTSHPKRHRRKSSVIPTLLPSINPSPVSPASPLPVSLSAESLAPAPKKIYRLTPYNYNPANGDRRYSAVGIVECPRDPFRKPRRALATPASKHRHAHHNSIHSLHSHRSYRSHRSSNSASSMYSAGGGTLAITANNYANIHTTFLQSSSPTKRTHLRRHNKSVSSVVSASLGESSASGASENEFKGLLANGNETGVTLSIPCSPNGAAKSKPTTELTIQSVVIPSSVSIWQLLFISHHVMIFSFFLFFLISFLLYIYVLQFL